MHYVTLIACRALAHYVVHMTTDATVGIVPPVLEQHRLQIARELTGLDRQDFAAELGVSRNTVSSTENGRTKPSRLLLKAWALRTGVSLTWLETGEAPTPPPGWAPRGSNPEPAVYVHRRADLRRRNLKVAV